jgi:hypothetical protein
MLDEGARGNRCAEAPVPAQEVTGEVARLVLNLTRATWEGE